MVDKYLSETTHNLDLDLLAFCALLVGIDLMSTSNSTHDSNTIAQTMMTNLTHPYALD
jgi:hypothetical protein